MQAPEGGRTKTEKTCGTEHREDGEKQGRERPGKGLGVLKERVEESTKIPSR